MQTAEERRRRKLAELVALHGRQEVADKGGVSAAYIDQLLKNTLVKSKADGSRSVRNVGNSIARRIEVGFGLAPGWFDGDDAPALDYDTLEFAQQYQRLLPGERQTLRLLYQVARTGVHPVNIRGARTGEASQPQDLMLGGESGLTPLDEPISPPRPKRPAGGSQ